MCLVNIGVSPSGKAQDFDSCIPMVRIHLPQPIYWGLAQLVARQTLTLMVKGSNPLSPAKSKSILDGNQV